MVRVFIETEVLCCGHDETDAIDTVTASPLMPKANALERPQFV